MRLNSAFELSVEPVDIKLPEIPLLEVGICKVCGGEEVWPQRGGGYPFVEIANPCECFPRAPYVGWREEMDARREAAEIQGNKKPASSARVLCR